MMELDLLTAVSPIDGRYRSKAGTLAAYFGCLFFRICAHEVSCAGGN